MRWRRNLHESWSQTGCGSRRADVFPVLSFIIQQSGAQFTDDGKKVGESGWERQDDFRLWEEGDGGTGMGGAGTADSPLTKGLPAMAF